MNGYPGWMVLLGSPMRPILRRFVLPRLLEGNSVQGVRTAGMFVPPENLDDSSELERFENCVTEFKRSTSRLLGLPGFGKMPREQFKRFHAAHAAHAAHHLSFLSNGSS